MASIAVLLSLASIAGWKFMSGRGGKAVAPVAAGDDARRIAVLYFQTAGTGDSLRFLADGLTEGLITQLGQVSELEVISSNGVAPFRGGNVPRDSIARLLKVGTLVEGSVEQERDKVRVTVRLVDAASGAEFQRASFEQPASQYLTLGDSLAQKAARLPARTPRCRGTNPRAAPACLQSRRPGYSCSGQRRSAVRPTRLVMPTPAAAGRAFEQADSLLAQASALDPKWTEPLVQRGTIASQQVYRVNTDPVLAAPYITKGLGFVEQALALDPAGSRSPLPARRAPLLAVAPAASRPIQSRPTSCSSRRRPTSSSPSRSIPREARAWASLAHLYNHTKGPTDAKLAARRAYEEDAYLANIDKVIDRLFYSSYDLAQFADAKQWCDEGQRRFPADYHFATCRLRLLATRAEEPDVARAWRLRDSADGARPRAGT